MWAFWPAFVVFLCEPRQLLSWWPLPTIDRAETLLHPLPAALIDLGLVALFGVQHSVMARPWFKRQIMRMPVAFERCTYVHMANLALFALILCLATAAPGALGCRQRLHPRRDLGRVCRWLGYPIPRCLVFRNPRPAWRRENAGLGPRPARTTAAPQDRLALSMASTPNVCRSAHRCVGYPPHERRSCLVGAGLHRLRADRHAV